MYKIDEDNVYTIEQVINKVAFIRKLSELGGDQSTYLTSEQIATIFIELEDQLKSIRSKIELI
ncbi:hypothetical protein [Acinetobacter sp. BSP-53]|uniref:hypothetical protein n=1 Tax=Acinetobacter sp. BSP-53 TaxID=3344662 RepID=UPI00376FC1E3